MSLDKWFKPKPGKNVKEGAKVLSSSQDKSGTPPPPIKLEKETKDIKKPKTSNKATKKAVKKEIKEEVKEEIEEEEVEEKINKSQKIKSTINVVVTKTPIDKDAHKKVSKPIEQKSTHFNAFSHDTSAKNKGHKFVPRGIGNFFGEDEFEKKNFVLTGVYDEFDRDEMRNYIIDFGGSVVGSISGKTAVLVAGEDPGPSKISKAQEKGIKIWSEDDVFNYAKRKLGITGAPQVVIPVKKEESESEQDDVIDVVAKGEYVWTEKYRPQKKSDLIGNKNQIQKFYSWIEKWDSVIPDRRAVLLAGSPGVGKTTVSKIVGKTMGYNPIEFNASDVRNKSAIDLAIKRIFLNGQINVGGGKTKQPLIIMDEVDGMSSGDRGGITQLVSYIKKTEQPIVCICNDVMDKKMQPLINVCETINFGKISPQDLAERLKYICGKEEVEVRDEDLMQISMKAHGDVRYAINMLQSFVKCGVAMGEKNEDVDYVEAVPTLITNYKSTTFAQKNDIFYMDTFMMPIYLHDSLFRAQKFSVLSKTFGAFAYGDIFQNLVGKTQNWKLMPITATFKVSISTYYGQTNNPGTKVMFPRTLAKVSKRKGNQTRLLLMTNKLPHKFMPTRDFAAVPLMYIRNTIMRLMEKDPKQAVSVALKFGLEKEIWEEMVKIGIGLEKIELFKSVPTGNKSQFTRELKQATNVVQKSSSGKTSKTKEEDQEEEDIEPMSEEEIEDEQPIFEGDDF